MASCAPAVTEEEEVVAPPKEEVVVTEEEVAPPPGEPTYGGVINLSGGSFYGFDEGWVIPPVCGPLNLTHQDLLWGDWAKGPAGTGEVTWIPPDFVPTAEIPCLAESWEMPDEETVVFHIRKGVHFHDKPPVNGREMTADDVAFSIKRASLSELPLSFAMRDPAGNIKSVEATDRYTVVVKCPPAYIWKRLVDLTEVMKILPPEAGGEWPGDFKDWETCIGTGPFMIVDEVAGSSLTFVKNPNFWMKDPVHPENILPYVDGVNWLVLPDASTRLAALRTGKIETLGRIGWEDKDSLVATNPKLQWVGREGGPGDMVGMRLDNPELPWHDIRVRRALAMGLNRQAIAEDYYGGNAKVFAWPIAPIPEYKDMFTPLEEFPESIQELYEYNPEKARELLAEAGYPDGFKAEILCTQTSADLLSIYKADWAKIGVDLEMQVKETGTFRTMVSRRTHKQMIFRRGTGDPQKLRQFRPGLEANLSIIDDPFINEIYETKMVKDVWDWEPLCQAMKEDVVPYILEQCWYIDPPGIYGYTFWQPWLKGYHGESNVGHLNGNAWAAYVWIDQELKKEMTGR